MLGIWNRRIDVLVPAESAAAETPHRQALLSRVQSLVAYTLAADEI
jgi:hypothetical protein